MPRFYPFTFSILLICTNWLGCVIKLDFLAEKNIIPKIIYVSLCQFLLLSLILISVNNRQNVFHFPKIFNFIFCWAKRLLENFPSSINKMKIKQLIWVTCRKEEISYLATCHCALQLNIYSMNVVFTKFIITLDNFGQFFIFWFR